MSKKSRVVTLQVLVSQHHALQGSAFLAAIIGELNRVIAADRVAKHNGWLLKVLYTTRALDTSLREIIACKGWDPSSDARSLSQYLKVLAGNSVVTPDQRNTYEKSLAHKRNKYMHEAGAMPDQLEAGQILNEMHACLSIVLANAR